ncbi:MAG: endonuclease domain-containing protein [Pseudomonadota bacterium]
MRAQASPSASKLLIRDNMARKTINRARLLRQKANYPERKAWEFLRTLRAEGVAVRRQVPIDGLTVDFAVRSKRLVIEIDGGIHDLEAVQIADAERDQRLEAAGWRVLRIPAETALGFEHLMAIVRPAVGLEE